MNPSKLALGMGLFFIGVGVMLAKDEDAWEKSVLDNRLHRIESSVSDMRRNANSAE